MNVQCSIAFKFNCTRSLRAIQCRSWLENMSDANTTSFSWEIQRKICKRGIKYFWKIERIQNLMIGSSKIHRCKQSVNLWKPENEPKTCFQLNPNIREVCQSNKLATLNIFWEKKPNYGHSCWQKSFSLLFFSIFWEQHDGSWEEVGAMC